VLIRSNDLTMIVQDHSHIRNRIEDGLTNLGVTQYLSFLLDNGQRLSTGH